MKNENLIYQNRKRMNLTQEQLAEKADVAVETIKKWEKGSLPRSMAHAKRLGKIFGDEDFVNQLYKNQQ